MAVAETQTSLAIYGATSADRAAYVTDALGIEPSYSHEHGDPYQSPRLAAQGKVMKHPTWLWHQPATGSTDDDFHGMQSLDLLAEHFEPHAAVLMKLSERYTLRILMSGFSDSTQGGFFVRLATMLRLGMFGAAFVPTVYLEDAETDEARHRRKLL